MLCQKQCTLKKQHRDRKLLSKFKQKNLTDKPITIRNQYQTKTEYVEEGKDF